MQTQPSTSLPSFSNIQVAATSPANTPKLERAAQFPKGEWSVLKVVSSKGVAHLLLHLMSQVDQTVKKIYLACGTDDEAIKNTLVARLTDAILIGDTPFKELDNDDDSWLCTPDGTVKLSRVHLQSSGSDKDRHEVTIETFSVAGAIERHSLHLKSSTPTAKLFTQRVRQALKNPCTLVDFFQARRSIADRVQATSTSPRGVSFDDVMTPAMAMACLERNQGNRIIHDDANLKPLLVAFNEPTVGPRETSSQISFHPTGNMANGQHRCVTTVLSGKTFDISFKFSLPIESRQYEDRGLGRTLPDQLDIELKDEGLPAGKDVVEMMRVLTRFQTSKPIRMEPGLTRYLIELYSLGLQRLQRFMESPPFKNVYVRTAFMIGLSGSHADKVMEIAHRCEEGSDLAAGSVLLQISKRMGEISAAKGLGTPDIIDEFLDLFRRVIKNHVPPPKGKVQKEEEAMAMFRPEGCDSFLGAYPVEQLFRGALRKL